MALIDKRCSPTVGSLGAQSSHMAKCASSSMSDGGMSPAWPSGERVNNARHRWRVRARTGALAPHLVHGAPEHVANVLEGGQVDAHLHRVGRRRPVRHRQHVVVDHVAEDFDECAAQQLREDLANQLT